MFDLTAQILEYYNDTLPNSIKASIIDDRETIYNELIQDLAKVETDFASECRVLQLNFEAKMSSNRAIIKDKIAKYNKKILESQSFQDSEYDLNMTLFNVTGDVQYQAKANKAKTTHNDKLERYEALKKQSLLEYNDETSLLNSDYTEDSMEIIDDYNSNKERINKIINNFDQYIEKCIAKEIEKQCLTPDQVNSLIREFKILCVHSHTIQFYLFPALATIELEEDRFYSNYCGQRLELVPLDQEADKEKFKLYPIAHWPTFAFDLIKAHNSKFGGFIDLADNNGVNISCIDGLTLVGSGSYHNGEIQNIVCKIYNNQVYFF